MYDYCILHLWALSNCIPEHYHTNCVPIVHNHLHNTSVLSRGCVSLFPSDN